MTEQHTKTPWSIQSSSISYAAGSKFVIRDSDGKDSCPVAEITTYTHPDRKDAAFIITACNAHEALVSALEELINSPNAKQNAMWDRARAALALAKKGVV